jgi:hypothetical protein
MSALLVSPVTVFASSLVSFPSIPSSFFFPFFLFFLLLFSFLSLCPSCSSPLWSTTSFFFSSCDSEGSGGFSAVSGDVIVPIGGLSVNDRVEVDLGISTLRFSWIWAVSRALSNDSYINGR